MELSTIDLRVIWVAVIPGPTAFTARSLALRMDRWKAASGSISALRHQAICMVYRKFSEI